MFPTAYYATTYFPIRYFPRPFGIVIDIGIPTLMSGFISDLSVEPDWSDAKIEAM